MQPITLNLPGSYYDSQIYSGRLYLWTLDGSIQIFEWRRLIDNIALEPRLQLALRYAFLSGNVLYSDEFKRLIHDEEIKGILQGRFQQLAETPIDISEQALNQALVREHDNPFPFPHADSAIHYSQVFVGDVSGIYSAPVGAMTDMHTLGDVPVTSIATSFQSVAVAAGNEGLYRLTWANDFAANGHGARGSEPKRIDSHPATFVHWMDQSLFSSAYNGKGYLVDYAYVGEEGRRSPSTKALLGTFSTDELFARRSRSRQADANSAESTPSFVWGAYDKVYAIDPGKLNVLQYEPGGSKAALAKLSPDDQHPAFHSFAEMEDFGVRRRFVDAGEHPLDLQPATIVRADNARFGVVVELDDALRIVTSTAESITFDGEPVNWRIFPDSQNYTNHLHIVYDDYLCIHSFNQDYFVPQRGKVFGIRVTR